MHEIKLQIYSFQCDYHKKKESLLIINLSRFIGERLNYQSGSGEESVLLLIKSPKTSLGAIKPEMLVNDCNDDLFGGSLRSSDF